MTGRPPRLYIYIALWVLLAIVVAILARPKPVPAANGTPLSEQQVTDALDDVGEPQADSRNFVRFRLESGVGVTIRAYNDEQAARNRVAGKSYDHCEDDYGAAPAP